jgi:TatA/E family protein of Tat protein translocase
VRERILSSRGADLLIVALLVLGPSRLPEAARSMGKAMAEFRRQTADIMDEFQVQALLEDEPPKRPPTPAPAPGATPAAAPAAAAKPESGSA